MGTMNDEDRQRLIEIHEFLLGDLKEQGFIGKTDDRISSLEKEMGNIKKFFTAIVIPLFLVIADKVIDLLNKQ